MADIEKNREFYYMRKKMQRRNLALTAMAAISITLLTGLAVIIAVMLVMNRKPDSSNDQPGAAITVETGQSDQTSTADTTAAQSQAEVSDTIPNESVTEPDVTEIQAPLENYDYTKPVPKSSPVDISYYDDALFIGDSRTEGFRIYAGLNNATYYATKGLMASSTFTEPFITPTDDMKIPNGAITDPDGKLTVAQALEYNSHFGKIYIMFGINELGWKNVDAFIDRYKSLVELAHKYHPDAFIYIQLIIPVSKSKSDSDDVYNNNRITMFNDQIKQMCIDEQVFYINTPEAVAGSDGTLPEDAGVDGVHMKRSYCELWRDYLFSHTVDT